MFSPLHDPTMLYAAVDRVRKNGGSSSTSTLFASQPQLARWVQNGELLWREAAETVLLQKRDRGFSRLYHVSTGVLALERALSDVPTDEPLVVDLVGKPREIAAVNDTYRTAGFAEHRSLIRMARVGSPFSDAPMNTAGAELASPTDVDSLHRFFLQLLDPFADQMPTKDDLQMAVEQQSVLTARPRPGSPLGAALVFDRTGMTSTLRYWYVDPALHNCGLGGLLMRRFFEACAGCRRFLLWVVENNQDSISKYRHYGFEPDQLIDRILVRRKG